MLPKKSPRANLENEKPMGILLGFVFALSFLFIALEWSHKEITVFADNRDGEYIPMEIFDIPITKEKKTPTAPIPPPSPKIIDVINIVDNDVDVQRIDFVSDNFDEPIQLLPPVPVKKDTDNIIVDFLPQEFMPRFQGNLDEFFADNIRYPSLAMQNGIHGKVICQFVVNKDGSIEDIAVVRGIDPSLDKEVLRVVSMMPDWKPGTQQGRPVRVRFTLPVAFTINK